jgi:hypothetical protein
MVGERFPSASAPACRWRTSAETLDLIEALERIEALLLRLEERLDLARVPAQATRGATEIAPEKEDRQ